MKAYNSDGHPKTPLNRTPSLHTDGTMTLLKHHLSSPPPPPLVYHQDQPPTRPSHMVLDSTLTFDLPTLAICVIGVTRIPPHTTTVHCRRRGRKVKRKEVVFLLIQMTNFISSNTIIVRYRGGNWLNQLRNRFMRLTTTKRFLNNTEKKRKKRQKKGKTAESGYDAVLKDMKSDQRLLGSYNSIQVRQHLNAKQIHSLQ